MNYEIQIRRKPQKSLAKIRTKVFPLDYFPLLQKIASEFYVMKKILYIIALLSMLGCQANWQKKVNVDKQLFETVKNAVVNLQYDDRVFQYSYTVTPYLGKIETNWFRTHKGEVKIKIICKVDENNYEVHVFQQLFFSTSQETRFAKSYKAKIENQIKEKNHNEENSE